MSNHTPGPWQAFHHSAGIGVTAKGKYADVAHCSGFDSKRTRDEELANAALIAAAPDLLALLKEVSEETRHPDYDWSVDLAQRVSAAIAKAEDK
jgi:hypothetical protein